MDKAKGQVIEALPNLFFIVQFENGKTMRAYLAGKLHKNFIRVVIGDMVEVTIPPTGDIGRITKRF